MRAGLRDPGFHHFTKNNAPMYRRPGLLAETFAAGIHAALSAIGTMPRDTSNEKEGNDRRRIEL
jgi:hypothetical protein